MTNTSLSRRADFRSLIDNIEEITVWFATSPQEFEYVSDGFEDIWGVPAEEVEADPERMIEGIHPEDRERVLSIVERSDSEASKESLEHRVVQPDGTVRWVQARIVPLRDDDGNVTEMVGITTDITEQKRREQELAALNRIVRHDIRNDMSIVLGWAELLSEHVDDEGEDSLRRILNAGEHIVELTEIARDYARTVTESDDVDVEAVPLRPRLKQELARRRDSFPGAEFVLEGEIPDVDVAGNEMLTSVFKNLLNNAVQHNDSATPRVELSCEDRGDHVIVRVADNGPGVPDDRKEEIFEKGEKGIESSGAGIGLYLVRTLVDQYGGDVWVEDGPTGGAVFVVRLPIVE